MTREQALEAIGSMIRYGRQHVGEVEFSAEDAGRTDIDFLCQGLPRGGGCRCHDYESAGHGWLCGAGRIRRDVSAECANSWTIRRDITLSAHCHDDLGLAVANSLAAVRAGVRQIECTINGIGERAGNASLEEVAVVLPVRKESFGVKTNIN